MLAQILFHFVSDRVRVFAGQSKSGRPILAKYKHFTTILAHTAEVFGDRLCMALPPAEEMIHLSLQIRSISQRIFRHDFPISQLPAVICCNE